MDAPSTTPHDAVFKQFLMHAETARDFLEIHLPVELRELCDLNTLHLESGSFIEESLKGHSTTCSIPCKCRAIPVICML